MAPEVLIPEEPKDKSSEQPGKWNLNQQKEELGEAPKFLCTEYTQISHWT